MSSGLPSDEVAEDYKNSLEDLTTNDKFQISNLTVIAKENTEHAMAISRVLENHIRTTPPSQKLPALYVVDSVVKNVGTPYTLFLGRNLYQTFMNAYTLVDQQTRRKLDEMLKTWKEPVPGSLDPRPVFPVDITRGIENALIKARTAALQQQQRNQPQDVLARGRNSATPPSWTHTPTPQQGTQHRYPLAGSQVGHGINGHSPGHGSESHTPQQGQNVDLAALHRDIENLIGTARAEFAANPFDVSIQQRLKALLDLQAILQRQQLPPDQLKLVRDQVSALAPPKPAAAAQPYSHPNVPIPNISTPPTQPIPQATSQPNLAALLNPNTLASLIQATANRQQSTPPPAVAGIIPQIQPSATPQPAATPVAENPLIASLRARGLLPPVPSTGTPPTGTSFSLPLLVPGQTPLASVSTPQSTTDITINVHMSTASIKITNQRMTDSIKRGQNRSWYVDERDWIKSREFDDDSGVAGTGGTGTATAEEEAAKKQPQKQWIRAPNDVTLRNAPCPICQEKFESTWSEDVQDWIWQDALKVGNRVYHASCYAEVTKDGSATTAARAGTPSGRMGTPDSVLGKRKAEDTDSPGSKVRIKTEPV
ncbi:hypothetical protein TCE0_039r13197 [Talaromyces pinophilus]|uniref:mRNA cleavage factor complex component Pcf11 n=1 Tax=Talaromyces pinophilus TaxID=128442 RepID=A0A6N4SLS2_TALPI|nr:hypothetical protein TCE0_039r13197 [Talaromyces pinophilus]